jgi:hypothetical protein
LLTPDGRTASVSNFGLLEVNHHVGTPGTAISVWDVEHGVELKRFELPSGSASPHGLNLRPPAYRELFTNAELGNEAMVVLDSKSEIVLRIFDLPHGVHNFIFDRNGTALFALTTENDVAGLTRITAPFLRLPRLSVRGDSRGRRTTDI